MKVIRIVTSTNYDNWEDFKLKRACIDIFLMLLNKLGTKPTYNIIEKYSFV